MEELRQITNSGRHDRLRERIHHNIDDMGSNLRGHMVIEHHTESVSISALVKSHGDILRDSTGIQVADQAGLETFGLVSSEDSSDGSDGRHGITPQLTER